MDDFVIQLVEYGELADAIDVLLAWLLDFAVLHGISRPLWASNFRLADSSGESSLMYIATSTSIRNNFFFKAPGFAFCTGCLLGLENQMPSSRMRLFGAITKV